MTSPSVAVAIEEDKLEIVKARLLTSASQPLEKLNEPIHRRGVINVLLRHFATEVPAIFRPNTPRLGQEYDEAACAGRLIQALEWYITGTENPAQLLTRLREICPQPELCAKVFKGGEPVYNCRDCGIDGTCVLCVECFNNSEHKNHRYRIASSNSGYCDCGDTEAWKQHATCRRHQKAISNADFLAALSDLVTEGDFERLNARLNLILQFVVDYCYILLKWQHSEVPEELRPQTAFEPVKTSEEEQPTVEPKGPYVAVLCNDETHTYEHVIYALSKSIRCDSKQATDYATAVDREGRCIILLDDTDKCQAVATQIGDITKKSSDKKLDVKVLHVDLYGHQTFATRLLQWATNLMNVSAHFRRQFWSLMYAPEHTSAVIDFPDDPVATVSLVEKLMLSDTTFWKSIRVQWHQLFMAGLLIEMEAKRHFARLFTRNYPALIADYMKDDHEQRVSVLCLSVQIFTVPSVAVMLVEEENILELMVNAFLDLNQVYHVLHGKFKFEAPHSIFPFRRSYQLLGDLHYIIDRPPTEWNDALRNSFCTGVEAFLKLLKRMQLMDSIVRQVNQHIEYEPGWETGINFQMKLAPTMKAMAEWCGSDEAVFYRTLNSALAIFRHTFASNNRNTRQLQQHVAGHSAYCWDYDVTKKEVTIHLPLNRFIAALLLHSSKYRLVYAEVTGNCLLADRPLPDALMELPLRTAVMIGQFRAGMWRRNGYSLINQVLFYFNVRLRDEMFDRDLLMLQLAASMMDPNEYLIHVLNKFNLLFLLDEQSQHQRPTNDESIRQTNTVIEEFFRIIYLVLVERFVPGLGAVTPADVIKREAIQWLCKDSMSNSDLMNHLSVTHSDSHLVYEDLILEVAEFRKPRNPTKHGQFVLKAEYYKDFNPFFYHYNRSDQSASLETQLRRRRTSKEKYVCCPPPPLPDFVAHFASINTILLADVLFALLKTILEKTADLNDNLFSDTHFQQVLYICGIGLQEELKRPGEFKFSAKCVDHGIVQLLEACNSRHIAPRIENHKDLLVWLFDKFKEVFSVQAAATASDALMVDVAETAEEASKSASTLSEAQQREEDELKSKRRAMATARKNRILAQMNAAQNAFLEENADYFKAEFPEAANQSQSGTLKSTNSDSMMDISIQLSSGVAIGVNQDTRAPHCTASFAEQDFFTCILCLEAQNVNSPERFLVLGAFVQKSTVLSVNRSHKSWITGSGNTGLLTQGQVIRNTCIVDSDLNYGPHLSTCTHYMHSDCFEKYLEMVSQQERRRATGRNPRVSYDISKGEFLCPLCECICNIALPIMPAVSLKTGGALRTDIPMEKFLSGLHSILSDSGCDGSTGWIEAHKYNETYSGYKKPFAELIQFLPSDIRSYFEDLHGEYQANLQTDTVAEFDVNRVAARRKLMLDCSMTAFTKIYGSAQVKEYCPNNPDALQAIFWSISFSIHALERQLRTERTSFAEIIDTRPYHTLKATISLVRAQMASVSFTVPRKIFLFLSNYLLVQGFYQSSPYSILNVDAFSMLVTLLSTCGALFVDQDNTNDTKKYAILLGNSADKNLIELALTFHLVQVILTSPELLDADSVKTPEGEAMEVDESSCSSLPPSSTASTSSSGDQTLAQFVIDVLTAAGHHFTASQVNGNRARLTALVRTKLTPFLRSATIFAHFLTDVKLPQALLESAAEKSSKSTTIEEYDLLCSYLGIPCSFSFLGINYLRSLALFWPRHPNIRDLFTTTTTGTEASSSSSQSPTTSSRTLLKPDRAYLTQPHPVNTLQKLPRDYSDLINSLAHFTCPSSNSEESRFPTMCLTCGEILCSQNYCCQKKLKREMIGACTYHAQFCGAGTGLFLRIRDCKILLLTTRGRGCYMPSPYVDKFGETDQGLLRGDPLYLSESSYENLYKIWLRHGIPEQIVHMLESHSQLTATNWNMM